MEVLIQVTFNKILFKDMELIFDQMGKNMLEIDLQIEWKEKEEWTIRMASIMMDISTMIKNVDMVFMFELMVILKLIFRQKI